MKRLLIIIVLVVVLLGGCFATFMNSVYGQDILTTYEMEPAIVIERGWTSVAPFVVVRTKSGDEYVFGEEHYNYPISKSVCIEKKIICTEDRSACAEVEIRLTHSCK